ncbi:4,5-DOPA dioxygenase extradiol [Oleiagrimonas sp.]|jgi:4,5-DOPA dioxygenase extradiol|uniref:4,5-DOPA-extradiol-dioxygenase n=1 Tax=Oleiagrimonas sp. TaxID=2010330 RepID=UPI00262979E1|nr:4,5-DOPA dioxygenase extradiol [Oleiagrimonas sp.]MDA3912976.1 4,5-DOPA dioxygenase extradiol [Oleiagrimonas sp.]
MTQRIPALFIGHGNPMNALLSNPWTEGWAAIGASIPLPRAVLSISAHWYLPGIAVTSMRRPRTIHDFGGFPQHLYELEYPARGDLQLAHRVRELLDPVPVEADLGWGLDHGTWSVLCHLYPKADIPVVQLSIDASKTAMFHYRLGQSLRPLRDEGVLLMGSGNIVHNLGAYAWSRSSVQPFDWAQRFESRCRALIRQREHAALVDYEGLGEVAAMCIPTPEHYLPLLYVLGAAHESDAIQFPVEGIDGGSISMLAVQMG